MTKHMLSKMKFRFGGAGQSNVWNLLFHLFLTLAFFCISVNAKAGSTLKAPVVTIGDCSSENHSEAGILVAQSGADEGKIVEVLSRIRAEYPKTREIVATWTHVPGALLVELKPELNEKITEILNSEDFPIVLDTGYQEFDSLNSRNRLFVIEHYDRFSTVVLCFKDKRLDMHSLRHIYSMLDEVEYVELIWRVGDPGSGIGLTAESDLFFVIFRNARGDCPSGCIFEEFLYFIVDDDMVRIVDLPEALETIEFQRILKQMSWSGEPRNQDPN